MARRRQRLIERRTIVGLSQEQLADAVGVDRTTIGRWDTAESAPQPAQRPRLAKALCVSVEELQELLSDVVEVPHPDGRARILRVGESQYYANLAMELIAGPEGWDEMQRRTLVLGVGGIAGLGLAPTLAMETARHGLTIASAQQRAEAAIDDWHETVSEYGYSYQTTDPAELLDLLIVDVLGIQYAIDCQEKNSASEASLRELRRSCALLAAFMAMTIANLGQTRHAARWWRTARRIAQQSADLETVAWVRGREVVRGIYEKRPLGSILRLITDAEACTYAAPARSLLELVSGKAQAFALAGRADDATAALRQLKGIYEDLPPEATADKATVLTWAEDRIRFTESFVHSQLGNTGQAAKAQEQALAAYPATYRRGPAQIELQRALCLVRSSDVTGGVRHAQQIVSGLSPAEHIQPIFDLSRRVLDAVPIEDRHHNAVAEFRDYVKVLDTSA